MSKLKLKIFFLLFYLFYFPMVSDAQIPSIPITNQFFPIPKVGENRNGVPTMLGPPADSEGPFQVVHNNVSFQKPESASKNPETKFAPKFEKNEIAGPTPFSSFIPLKTITSGPEKGPFFKEIGQYDPQLDNRLKAPVKKIGMFGLPIKTVENFFLENGAKSVSYVLGKYSRMTLGNGVFTLYFDKNKRLGGVTINPRPQTDFLDSEVIKFVFANFLNRTNLREFRTVFAPEKIEIWFKGKTVR